MAQLFPRLAKAALILENYTIIVFSPLISIMSLLLVPNMVISKMNNHEHRTKQTYESYTFQPPISFWFLAGQGHVVSASQSLAVVFSFVALAKSSVVVFAVPYYLHEKVVAIGPH